MQQRRANGGCEPLSFDTKPRQQIPAVQDSARCWFTPWFHIVGTVYFAGAALYEIAAWLMQLVRCQPMTAQH